MDGTLELIRAAAAGHGFNLTAAVAAWRYDAATQAATRSERLSPRCQSIVVLGNGGADFWHAVNRHAQIHPEWFAREHPLDDYTRWAVEQDLAPRLAARGVRFSIAYPFVGNEPRLDFVTLGKVAGLGVVGLVGVLIHPTYGPWIAFRAALLLEEEIEQLGPAIGFEPCPGCTTRSCIAACPAQAVGTAGWEIARCLKHRVEARPSCDSRCHARVACVIGPEHRYPDDELAYHQERALRVMEPYYRRHVKAAESPA